MLNIYFTELVSEGCQKKVQLPKANPENEFDLAVEPTQSRSATSRSYTQLA
jgi:hypothetical protein